MFKRNDNRAVLRVRLQTVSPLLIRSGEAGLDPGFADLTCVRTHHAQYGTTVFIPGSSVKGVVRSAAESSIRGKRIDNIDGACDPLNSKASCASKFNARNKPRSEDVHKGHCLACRTFGST